MFTLRGLPGLYNLDLPNIPGRCLGFGYTGLGAVPFNPAVQQQTNLPNAGVFTHEATSNIVATPMTWKAVEALAKTTVKNYYDREYAAVKAMTPFVNSTCPPESKTKSCVGCTDTCYNYSATTPAATIPGGFEWFGVPFNVAELGGVSKSPKFERLYIPNQEQRIWAEYLIIKKSIKFNPTGVIVEGRGQSRALSVQEVLDRSPNLKLGLNNMAIRPISPTTDEFTKEGGYKKWVKRGGFLISLDVAKGKIPVADPSCPMVCTSILCKCGSSQFPACIAAGIPNSQPDNLGGCFRPYIGIYQGPPWYFVLSLVHDDPNWLERAGAKIENFMQAMGNAFCSQAPATQDQLNKTVAEKCVDKNNKPCVKGSSGCTCTTPSASAQGGVGLFNFFAAKWCAGWNKEQAAYNPAAPLPPVPDPPPYVPPSSLLPWPLVIAGGVVAGAIVFSRK